MKYLIFIILALLGIILIFSAFYIPFNRKSSAPNNQFIPGINSDQTDEMNTSSVSVEGLSETNNATNTLPAGSDSLENSFDLPVQLVYEVPFTAQAPFGNWEDVRQDYGCEEACLLMAMKWVKNEELSSQEALEEIIAMSDYQLKNYQHHHDTSISDTFKLLKDYYDYENAFIEDGIGVADIRRELASGNLVIIPVDGMVLDNKYYSDPGPRQHQVLVIGYDDETSELIVHDPGTSRGEAYRYSYELTRRAIKDYESGLNEPFSQTSTSMLVISK